MSITYPDPEVEEGFRLVYGNNNNYSITNAYLDPEYFRKVRNDWYNEPEDIDPETAAFRAAVKHPQPQTTTNGEDPFAELKAFIRLKEKTTLYPYLDPKRNITECDGNMDENSKQFHRHPWYNVQTGSYATWDEVEAERQKLLKQPLNRIADFYKDKTNLRLPQQYCDNLLDYNIRIRDQELPRTIPNYHKMSQSMKNALLETHFTSNLFNDWTRLKDGARDLDKDYMCDNLHRSEDKRPDMVDRNKWAYDQCMKGYFLK